jgi:chorismate dehydratase
MLAAGEAEAALIPVIEYQRMAGVCVVPDIAVASKRTVESVVLAARVPIEAVNSVAVDTSSRTTAALIQIIFRQFYGRAPRFTPWAPSLADMLETNDAAIIIGDPAMMIDRAALRVYDMAAEWRKHTGLPFVFAFWAVRADAAHRLGGVDFAAAKAEGLARRAELAAEYSAELKQPPEALLAYLTENINYDLDEENLAGLQLYYRLARECGLIPAARELEFLPLTRKNDR